MIRFKSNSERVTGNAWREIGSGDVAPLSLRPEPTPQPEIKFRSTFAIFFLLLIGGLTVLVGSGCQPATNSSSQISTWVAELETNVPVDTLVICPEDLQPGLKDWIAYRTEQGRTIQVVAPRADAASVTQQVREVAGQNPLEFVFLIGDVGEKRRIARLHRPEPKPAARLRTPDQQEDSAQPRSTSNTVPAHYITAEVNQNFGSEPEILSDHPYSDVTDDGLPDLAIGRLPAQSVTEVRDYLKRVMDYEQQPTPDQSWKRRIHFVAGVGGFGQAIDSVLEQVTKEVITGMIPAEYEISMTLGSWRSPFCPDPRKFEQTVISKFNEGCQFLVYIGHGLPTELGRFKLPDREFPIFNCQTATDVKCTNGSPIAIFLACYTGAIDHQRDCLSTVLLRQPCGPIAVISGTRVTMPYGMSVLMLEFADRLFTEQPETLGELLQQAKRNMVLHQSTSLVNQPAATAEPTQLDRLRKMVQGTGLALSPSPDLLTAECVEHLHMMHLFGDPLLQLKKPERISVTTAATVKTGSRLKIQGQTPLPGKLCAELVYPRDRFRKRPQYRRSYRGTNQDFERYQQAYQDAHDLTCGVCIQTVSAGPFELELPIPEDVSGECVVRCMLTTDDGKFALGSTRLTIEQE